jgi:GNAT superfamily N-acetyltransferase
VAKIYQGWEPEGGSGLLLAQLGVAREFQGRGIGKAHIREVFRRAIGLVQTVGCAAIVADPVAEAAKHMYVGFDFQPLGDGSTRMIVAMRTVVAGSAEIGDTLS